MVRFKLSCKSRFSLCGAAFSEWTLQGGYFLFSVLYFIHSYCCSQRFPTQKSFLLSQEKLSNISIKGEEVIYQQKAKLIKSEFCKEAWKLYTWQTVEIIVTEFIFKNLLMAYVFNKHFCIEVRDVIAVFLDNLLFVIKTDTRDNHIKSEDTWFPQLPPKNTNWEHLTVGKLLCESLCCSII